jgi:hypothetical protein
LTPDRSLGLRQPADACAPPEHRPSASSSNGGRSRVLAGIDTHKDTLAVAVIDLAGRPVIVTELANTEASFDALEELVKEHSVSRVGTEGSGNYGRGAAIRLALTGVLEVVEVPPSLTARERSAGPEPGRPIPGTRSPSPGSPPARPACHRSASPSAKPRPCGRWPTTAPNWSPSAPRWPAAPTPSSTDCCPAIRTECPG